MPTGQLSTRVRHVPELDSLRGFAAVVVMLYHFYRLWQGTPHDRWAEHLLTASPLRLFVSGRAAVVLFFLLSGFVLSLPRLIHKQRPYGAYLLQRICRIYLPYLAALAVAVAGCFRWHGATGYGGWFSLTWYAPPHWRLVLQHVLFLGSYDDAAYNTAFWSLVQEMRISLFFPALYLLVSRLPWRWAAVLPVALTAATRAVLLTTAVPEHVMWTLNYTGAFVYGILLARHRAELELWLGRLGRWGYSSVVAIAFLLFMVPDRASRLLAGLGPPGVDLLMMWGGCGVMLLAMGQRHALHLLRSRAARGLGHISYSVYLLHGTVLFALVYLFGRPSNVWPLLLPYFVLTLLAGAGMYWLVERPSKTLGRWLARRAEGAWAVPAES